MLSVKEIRCKISEQADKTLRTEEPLTCITRVDLHGLEPLVRRQWRTRPFPDASQFPLAGESVALCDNRGRVPVAESNVAAVEVQEYRQTALRWRLVTVCQRPIGSVAADTISYSVWS